MATNPNPVIQAIKNSISYNWHQHCGTSKKAARQMRVPVWKKKKVRKTGRYAVSKESLMEKA